MKYCSQLNRRYHRPPLRGGGCAILAPTHSDATEHPFIRACESSGLWRRCAAERECRHAHNQLQGQPTGSARWCSSCRSGRSAHLERVSERRCKTRASTSFVGRMGASSSGSDGTASPGCSCCPCRGSAQQDHSSLAVARERSAAQRQHARSQRAQLQRAARCVVCAVRAAWTLPGTSASAEAAAARQLAAGTSECWASQSTSLLPRKAQIRRGSQ